MEFTAIAAAVLIIVLTSIGYRYICKQDKIGWICAMILKRAKAYNIKNRPKRLILIRHGESKANVDSNVYSEISDHEISLTEKGKEQARNCGQKLKELIGVNEKLIFYVSPFTRSRQTCQIICDQFPKSSISKVREDPRIREQEWGNLQDPETRNKVLAEREKIGRFYYRFSTGESGADVYDRVSLFVDTLYRESSYNIGTDTTILIVSHGLFMRLFLMRFYRWSVEKFHSLGNFENCEYCIMERDDEDGSYILKTELRTNSK